MFYDDVYPDQLTGTGDKDGDGVSGDEITLPRCQGALDQDLQYMEPGKVSQDLHWNKDNFRMK